MQQNIIESLLLLVVGISVVFTALLILAGMIRMLDWIDRSINALRIRKYSAKVETLQIDDDVNDEIVAVLSAAVTTVLNQQVRIRKIRFLSGGPAPAWAVTGRVNIMASHAISKRKS